MLIKSLKMKKILSIILIILSICYSYGQKYILLNQLKENYQVKEYTFKTKQIYGIDKKITVYNVFVTKENIILLSVLPSFKNEKLVPLTSIGYNKHTNTLSTKSIEINNDENWEKIDYEKIKNNIISASSIENDMISEWGIDITPEKKTFKYQLIKKIGSDYYVTKNCLTEFFIIANSQYPITTPYGTINIAENKVTIKEMQEAFKKQYPKDVFPLDIWEKSQSRGGDGVYTVRNYLSKEYKMNNDNVYQFWTLDSWWSMHGDNHHRGIDRFVYIPEKGIVGGSYDFYFRDPRGFRIADTVLWQNIINEKVMIAEELK